MNNMPQVLHSPVSTTRTVEDTSFEEEGSAKVQKMNSDTPPWELLLKAIEEVKMETCAVKAEVKATNSRLDSMLSKITELEDRVAVGDERLANLEDKVERLANENAALRGNLDNFRSDLDSQIDRGLRDHLVFYGVPGSERTWEESAEKLAGWLATNVGVKSKEEFDAGIHRCHRGAFNPEKRGPRPIFVKINDRLAELIKTKMKFRNIGGVTVREQFSVNTQGRLNEALVYRKDFKARNPNSKAFISYPAVVKVKQPGEEGYKVVHKF